MVDKEIFSRISRRIDSHIDDMIKLQTDLTALPALAPESGGDGEYRKAQFLIDHLRSMGVKDIDEFNAADKRVSSGVRPNIVATIPGKNPDRTVWILTHTDIVPPGELEFWDDDPYKGYVKDGRIYGRGTEDNQQDLVASLFAAGAFIEEEIMPESNIGLVFVADEETGSIKGLEHLLKMKKDLFHKSDIIVVPDFGNEEGSIIEVAEKSILWLKFKTVGKQCHASIPAIGKNAFRAASHLVVALGALYKVFSDSDALYNPPVSTFEPTKKDSNVPNVNTIPGEDVFYLDSRILPSFDISAVMAEIRKMADEIERRFDVSIEIETVQAVQAPQPTPDDAPVVKALQESIMEIYGISAVPAGIGGGTVAAHLRKAGYPAAVWSRLGMTAHQPNENCSISNMVANAKVYAHLFLQKQVFP